MAVALSPLVIRLFVKPPLVPLLAVATSVAGFWSLGNLRTLTESIATDGIVVVGMTIVMIAGGFDLSVGAVMAMGGVAGVVLLTYGIVAAIAGAAFFGGLSGLLSGTLVTLLAHQSLHRHARRHGHGPRRHARLYRHASGGQPRRHLPRPRRRPPASLRLPHHGRESRWRRTCCSRHGPGAGTSMPSAPTSVPRQWRASPSSGSRCSATCSPACSPAPPDCCLPRGSAPARRSSARRRR